MPRKEKEGCVMETDAIFAGSMDNGTLHGLTNRVEAVRDDLIDELPPDPRDIPFRGRVHGSPGKTVTGAVT
jgi:hypothetical protein